MPTTYDTFNLNPVPQSGQGVYGKVPGTLGLPSPATDLAAQFPGLAQANQAASTGLLARLRGQLSPDTQAMLQNTGAEFGVRSGMPGGGLSKYRTLRDLGRMSEDVQSQAIKDYGTLAGTISGTQTVNPALQADIAATNAVNRAAPNPAQAGSHAESLFNQYLAQMRGGGGAATPSRNTQATDWRSWASDRPNPAAGGRVGYFQDVVPNTGSGTVYNVGGAGTRTGTTGDGGMSEYDWIANQGFDPASFGVMPTSSGSMSITPNIGGGVQGPWLPTDYLNPIGPEMGANRTFEQQYPNLSNAPEEDLADMGL